MDGVGDGWASTGGDPCRASMRWQGKTDRHSASGDCTGSIWHADVSYTGHVQPRSLEVSGMSCTDLAAQTLESHPPTEQPAAPSGDCTSSRWHADVSYTGHVEPRSLEVSDMSCTGLAALTLESHPPAEQPAAPQRVDASRPSHGVVMCAQPQTKTTTKRSCVSRPSQVLLEKLGEGSYGKVYKCTWRGRTMAVKV